MLEPLKYTTIPPDYPADRILEAFCENLVRSYHDNWQTLTVLTLAYDFRVYFDLTRGTTTGDMTYLLRRLNVRTIFNPEMPSSLFAEWNYNSVKSSYEIHTGVDNGEQRESLLHEIFEILFWRCFYIGPWWKQWMQHVGVQQPHQLADQFAKEVLVSTVEFQQWAPRLGYDTFGMAGYFNINPIACTRKMQKATSPKCPLFTAYLRSCPKEKVQEELFTLEPCLHAEVATYFCKQPKSWKQRGQAHAIEVLSHQISRRRRLAIEGEFYDALEKGNEARLHTNALEVRTEKPILAFVRSRS